MRQMPFKTFRKYCRYKASPFVEDKCLNPKGYARFLGGLPRCGEDICPVWRSLGGKAMKGENKAKGKRKPKGRGKI